MSRPCVAPTRRVSTRTDGLHVRNGCSEYACGEELIGTRILNYVEPYLKVDMYYTATSIRARYKSSLPAAAPARGVPAADCHRRMLLVHFVAATWAALVTPAAAWLQESTTSSSSGGGAAGSISTQLTRTRTTVTLGIACVKLCRPVLSAGSQLAVRPTLGNVTY